MFYKTKCPKCNKDCYYIEIDRAKYGYYTKNIKYKELSKLLGIPVFYRNVHKCFSKIVEIK